MLSRIMFDPLAEMRSMDEMFNRMFGERFGGSLGHQPQTATLPVDILERNGNLMIRAAIPGVKPEDIDVSVDNNVLTIRGESHSETEDVNTKVYRREVSYGSFVRSIRLPEGLQLDKVDAEFNHGTLLVTIPRVQQEQAQPQRISVRTHSQGADSVAIQSEGAGNPRGLNYTKEKSEGHKREGLTNS